MASTVYIVQQGDTLSSIARQNGFENFEPIWNHPENESLRTRRDNPHALLPGDEIAVPDKKLRTFNANTNAEHRYQVFLRKVILRVRARDTAGQPLANTAATLTFAGNTVSLTTDGNGQVERAIPGDLFDATLTVGTYTFPLDVGHLDPIDERSGQQARLKGLGYFGEAVLEEADATDDRKLADDEAFQLALELFRYDQKLSIDGDIGPADLDALQKAFGC